MSRKKRWSQKCEVRTLPSGPNVTFSVRSSVTEEFCESRNKWDRKWYVPYNDDEYHRKYVPYNDDEYHRRYNEREQRKGEFKPQSIALPTSRGLVKIPRFEPRFSDQCFQKEVTQRIRNEHPEFEEMYDGYQHNIGRFYDRPERAWRHGWYQGQNFTEEEIQRRKDLTDQFEAVHKEVVRSLREQLRDEDEYEEFIGGDFHIGTKTVVFTSQMNVRT